MVLDLRQYSDQPPCLPLTCLNPDLDNPNRTRLGAGQKQWLKAQMAGSTADWCCIGSSLLMADFFAALGVAAYPSTWSGYVAERTELLNDMVANGMKNVVVLSGDWHRSIVAELEIRTGLLGLQRVKVASEFSCPALTSSSQNPSNIAERLLYYPVNPHVRYYESEHNGYVINDLTKTTWTATYKAVNRGNPVSSAQTLAVPSEQRNAGHQYGFWQWRQPVGPPRASLPAPVGAIHC